MREGVYSSEVENQEDLFIARAPLPLLNEPLSSSSSTRLQQLAVARYFTSPEQEGFEEKMSFFARGNRLADEINPLSLSLINFSLGFA